MSDEEILLLANGTFTTAQRSTEFIAFARAIESRTLIKTKAEWYLLGAEDEREACAEICDRFQARDVGMQPAECAGAIRLRGKQ